MYGHDDDEEEVLREHDGVQVREVAGNVGGRRRAVVVAARAAARMPGAVARWRASAGDMGVSRKRVGNDNNGR